MFGLGHAGRKEHRNEKILEIFGLGLIAYSPTYVYRVLVWQDSDAFDRQKFPNHPLCAAPTTYHFDSAPDSHAKEWLALFYEFASKY